MKRLAAGVALVVAVTLVPAPNQAAASLGQAIPLEMRRFFDMVVDTTNEQIYLTGGKLSHEVVVLDLDGNPVGSVGGLLDPSGLALSTDAATLYVALPKSHGVAAISTSTLTVTETHLMPFDYCPGTVAVTGSYLVVGLDCPTWAENGDRDAPGDLALLDLEGGGPWVEFGQVDDPPYVIAAAGAPGTVVAYGWNQADASVYDVTVDPPTQIGEYDGFYRMSDGVLLPDGSQFIAAGQGEDDVASFTVPQLTQSSIYNTLWSPQAVAVSGDGSIVATGVDDASAYSIRLHNAGSPATRRKYWMDEEMVGGGLALDATASRVYVITSSDGPFLNLHILPGFGWPRCDGRVPNIVGTESDDTLVGTGGNDVILALGGDDLIVGHGGNDTICAGPGNDLIRPGAGDDVVFGDEDHDTVDFSDSAVSITVDLTAGVASGDGEDQVVSVESAIGSAFADSMTGTAAANLLSGGAGDDAIGGLGGPDLILGGTGADTLFGHGGRDLIEGGGGDDFLSGGGSADELHGDEGDDALYGGSANDILTGGSDSDQLIGGSGDDTLTGGTENDLLAGEGGEDVLRGGKGHDLLLGGPGADVLSGWKGHDTLAGGPDDDQVDGGAGTDTASFIDSPSGVVASLVAGTSVGEGSDVLVSIEWLVGTEHADVLNGNAGDNLLDARGGNDSVVGGAGDDFLQGGTGIDTLRAGSGDDLCAEGEQVYKCEAILGLAAADKIVADYSRFMARGAHLLSIDGYRPD